MGEVTTMKCLTVRCNVQLGKKTKIKTKCHLRKWRYDELCTLADVSLLFLALNESHLISSLPLLYFAHRLSQLQQPWTHYE